MDEPDLTGSPAPTPGSKVPGPGSAAPAPGAADARIAGDHANAADARPGAAAHTHADDAIAGRSGTPAGRAEPSAAQATATAAISTLTPRDRRWLTILLTLGSIALFFVVLDQLAKVWSVFSDLILIFFFAWLLGFILEPIAAWLARFVPRAVAVAIAYGAVAVAAGGLIVVIASALFTSISDFLQNLPQFQNDLVAMVRPISDWLVSLGFNQVDLTKQVQAVLTSLAAQAQDLLGPLQDIAVASLGFVGNILIVFFLALFISFDRAAIGSFLLRLVPPAYSDEAHLLSESVGRSFGGFIRGMSVVGVTYALVALTCNLVLGLDYAALTTTMSGVLMAIPFFGPFVSWAPPVIVAAVTKPDVLIPAAAIMGVGWFLNQNVLQPRVLSGAVGLHPVVVLASVLIGNKLFGVPGAVFGLPVAAVISSFFFYFLRRNMRPDERSVAARAARRLAERDGRPKRVPREPKPGEVEEIPGDDIGGPADAAPMRALATAVGDAVQGDPAVAPEATPGAQGASGEPAAPA